MIKFHPNDQMLRSFVVAELPASLSVAVSMHVEMCEKCQKRVVELQEQAAKEKIDNEVTLQAEVSEDDFDLMFNDIVADETFDLPKFVNAQTLNTKGGDIKLPRAINSLKLSEWSSLGKLSRCRVMLDDGEMRSSILHIDQQGEVPSHTHKGFEVTVMLDGSYTDELGTYHKGDFIWLDHEHTHNPVSKDGCVCYTVVSDSLHFTSGVSRLLNPIGKLIY